MPNWPAISIAVLLLAAADVPRVNSLRAPSETGRAPSVFSSGDEIALFPVSNEDGDSAQATTNAAPKPSSKKGALDDEEKLQLIRYVSGEFARALKELPAGKDGFIVNVGQPISDEQLQRAVATHGTAVHSGDNVQITKLDFRDKEIIVDLNGGGRGKKRWRDRIHLDVGGLPTMTSTTTQQESGPPGMQPGQGSTVYLAFSKSVPDLSPDELKQLLSPLLDFRKQRSASVQWFDTLPPDIKKAITDRKPVVGMDREMVVAAVGKPDHKVRERDAEGNDIEDWIYGQPPSKTVFVRFTGDRVTSIKQFPQ
ncbi:MAG TPA: hypothetical protein VJP87_00630 [Candidatus Acidoferrales bacterium]|nr:hypothetical protein [Candidatus Acidoferrales bacterium]